MKQSNSMLLAILIGITLILSACNTNTGKLSAKDAQSLDQLEVQVEQQMWDGIQGKSEGDSIQVQFPYQGSTHKLTLIIGPLVEEQRDGSTYITRSMIIDQWINQRTGQPYAYSLLEEEGIQQASGTCKWIGCGTPDPGYECTTNEPCDPDYGCNAICILGPGGGSCQSSGEACKKDDSCFSAGTKIAMSDGTEKNIEDVVVGDSVLSFDEKTGIKVSAKVLQLEAPIRD
ncbi:MAG: Hint domain-containing protein, partial [Nanoarchaeota archaeon]